MEDVVREASSDIIVNPASPVQYNLGGVHRLSCSQVEFFRLSSDQLRGLACLQKWSTLSAPSALLSNLQQHRHVANWYKMLTGGHGKFSKKCAGAPRRKFIDKRGVLAVRYSLTIYRCIPVATFLAGYKISK